MLDVPVLISGGGAVGLMASLLLSQHGVRSLFIMDNLVEVPVELPFKTYGRALEWGYPMGVGYRYLSFSQCWLLLRATQVAEKIRDVLMEPLLRV